MAAELDYDLTPDQWEALKTIRRPVSERRSLRVPAVQQLLQLQLADEIDGAPVLTPLGRKVLIRGSSSLLDLVA
ncbi:hypothetical protein [Bradyrhizobium sp.]|uniref:hypothetical protein n=1 Tax=Bradyrhizobium sp. TaxID=376 RepID=UPI001DFC2684|nr:hypothetical protein [Bradyrhizobium sp.]MBV8697147.1 hypothetical protein [Bradyrhizobium sp.]MBV8920086.1 hypothetical protein [Bradyrhizobium sp.]MBV9982951.1 hypothetical protein [Bradyrhizobium sp.]